MPSGEVGALVAAVGADVTPSGNVGALVVAVVGAAVLIVVVGAAVEVVVGFAVPGCEPVGAKVSWLVGTEV